MFVYRVGDDGAGGAVGDGGAPDTLSEGMEGTGGTPENRFSRIDFLKPGNSPRLRFGSSDEPLSRDAVNCPGNDTRD